MGSNIIMCFWTWFMFFEKWFLVLLFWKYYFSGSLVIHCCYFSLCSPIHNEPYFNNYFYDDFFFIISDSKHFWHITFAVSSSSDAGLSVILCLLDIPNMSRWFYWSKFCPIRMKQEEGNWCYCKIVPCCLVGHVYHKPPPYFCIVKSLRHLGHISF